MNINRFTSQVSRRLSPRGFAAGLLLLSGLVLGAGCPTTQDQGPVDSGGDAGTSGARTTGEPNNNFGEAIDMILDANGAGRLTGAIPSTSDVDVYRLGAMNPGDRIIVDVSASGGLDADVAIFDEGGRLVFENDDRNLDLGQYDPFVNFVVRHASSIYYVAIASSPLNPTTGIYDAGITVTRGGTVPSTAGQIIAVDTDGGSVTISGDTFTVGAFDTAHIDRRYAGMTTAVVDQIVATILENYAGLQLSVIVIPRNPVPAGGQVSTILLGGTNPEAYGLAEQIDYYNADHTDQAIVFTDMFTPSQFNNRVLTAQELGTAIGNIVSHEAGHLLGLNHVDNVRDLMDTTGTANTFLLDQDFTTSTLDGSIFPIGTQDGMLLLLETLGVLQ